MKRALAGSTEVQAVFVKIVNQASGPKTFQLFDNREEAVDWLVKD